MQLHPEQIDLLAVAAHFGLDAYLDEQGVVIRQDYYDIETGEVGTDELHCRNLAEIDRAIIHIIPAPC